MIGNVWSRPNSAVHLSRPRLVSEPGFNCPEGLELLLKKYIHMRNVSVPSTTIVLMGECVHQVEFNQAIADVLKSLDLTTISTYHLNVIDQNVQVKQRKLSEMLSYFVFYLCKDNIARTSRFKKLNHDRNIIAQVRPYILFVVDDTQKILTNYGHISQCRVYSDHILIDVLFVHKVLRRGDVLTALSDTQLQTELVAIKPRLIQPLHTVHLDIEFTVKTNETLEQRRVLFMLSADDAPYLRELSFVNRLDCMKPLAVIEPSERVLLPSTLPTTFYVGLLLSICIVSFAVGAGRALDVSSLLYQLSISILTSYAVKVPRMKKYFYVQRIALLTLFVPVLQWVFVTDYKNEVVAELTEPERDIFPIQADENLLRRAILPFRADQVYRRTTSFIQLIYGFELCYPASNRVQDYLGIPMKMKFVYIEFGPMMHPALRPSPVLSLIREYQLVSLIQRFLKFSPFNKFQIKTSVSESRYLHKAFFPNSSYLPEFDWEVIRELAAECNTIFRNKLLVKLPNRLSWCFQEVLIDHSQLSAKLRWEHILNVNRLFITLLSTSVFIAGIEICSMTRLFR